MSPELWEKNYVILAISSDVRLALPFSHGDLLSSECGGLLKGGFYYIWIAYIWADVESPYGPAPMIPRSHFDIGLILRCTICTINARSEISSCDACPSYG
jgi:hypothetical protein